MELTQQFPEGNEYKNQREALWRRGEEIILAAPQLYVDFDIESDGIAGAGSILSIGAQSPTGESFFSELKPMFDTFVPRQREWAETNGLERDRLLKEAPDAIEVINNFNEWALELKQKYGKPVVLSALAAEFDVSMLKMYFAKADLFEDYPFELAPLDLKSLALALTDNWDWKETSKGKLPEIILPDDEFSHNPLEDAQYQQKIHFGLAALIEHQNTKPN